jgi:hypothetical protein
MSSDRHDDDEYSAEFPREYGDFELKSSDNVMFSFPRGLLAHVSPVFKDMFSIGTTSDHNQEQPLLLTEDAEAIKQFLLYIDPLKDSPKFTVDTVMPFVEAAMKYQVPRMIETFELWAKENDTGAKVIERDPMLFLSLAERFSLPKIGSIAMKFAARADERTIRNPQSPISTTSNLQIMEMRAERTQLLVAKSAEFVRSRLADIQPRPTATYYGSNKSSNSKQSCYDCVNNLQDLLVRTVTRLPKEPSRSIFLSEGMACIGSKCGSCGKNLWSEINREACLTIPPPTPQSQVFERLTAEFQAIEARASPVKSLM